MDDLVTWLREQLDEDERAARKAAAVCGCHPPATRWLFSEESTDGRILVVDDPHPDPRRRLARRWNRTFDGLFMAEHIARHDPARVLAEVDAKRRILDFLEYDRVDVSQAAGPPITVPGQRPAIAHPVLCMLALPYAGRPGYRDEWRP
ncbi:DUF6221 family protein [Micromonospora sp. WMMD718]|uniref:DUF6221 family protein n=1 Tax=Micromonospora sp. WMMD718 TaxID=3016098 RepID=UPI002417ABDE|nr:DUF6221 family protein [Micromonospora sp. WMMD718]MDG4749324.1 DUF6221 family protein [Micromonospora sp. WMMD718]MDG4756066.1 DUF6221 family protein [Micromonospora sp. WMMD718]